MQHGEPNAGIPLSYKTPLPTLHGAATGKWQNCSNGATRTPAVRLAGSPCALGFRPPKIARPSMRNLFGLWADRDFRFVEEVFGLVCKASLGLSMTPYASSES